MILGKSLHHQMVLEPPKWSSGFPQKQWGFQSGGLPPKWIWKNDHRKTYFPGRGTTFICCENCYLLFMPSYDFLLMGPHPPLPTPLRFRFAPLHPIVRRARQSPAGWSWAWKDHKLLSSRMHLGKMIKNKARKRRIYLLVTTPPPHHPPHPPPGEKKLTRIGFEGVLTRQRCAEKWCAISLGPACVESGLTE